MGIALADEQFVDKGITHIDIAQQAAIAVGIRDILFQPDILTFHQLLILGGRFLAKALHRLAGIDRFRSIDTDIAETLPALDLDRIAIDDPHHFYCLQVPRCQCDRRWLRCRGHAARNYSGGSASPFPLRLLFEEGDDLAFQAGAQGGAVADGGGAFTLRDPFQDDVFQFPHRDRLSGRSFALGDHDRGGEDDQESGGERQPEGKCSFHEGKKKMREISASS